MATGPSGPHSAISAPGTFVLLCLPTQGSEVLSDVAVIAFLAKGRAASLGVRITAVGALCIVVCCCGFLVYR